MLVGVIEAIGEPLSGPLDRTPCVAYSYEVLIDRGSGKSRTIVKVAHGAPVLRWPCLAATRKPAVASCQPG